MLLRVISTLPQLNGMKNETWIYALIAVACVVLLTFVVASLINYEGGEDRSYVKRRIAAVSIVVAISAAFFVYFDLVAKNAILNPGFQSMYTSTCIWCVALVFFGSIVVNVILMFLFRHSKYGSILFKMKK
jgi:hypothetical protein